MCADQRHTSTARPIYQKSTINGILSHSAVSSVSNIIRLQLLIVLFRGVDETVVQLSVIEYGSLIILALNVFLMKCNRADWSVQDSSSAKVQPLDGYLNNFHVLMSPKFDSFASRPEVYTSSYLCL